MFWAGGLLDVVAFAVPLATCTTGVGRTAVACVPPRLRTTTFTVNAWPRETRAGRVPASTLSAAGSCTCDMPELTAGAVTVAPAPSRPVAPVDSENEPVPAPSVKRYVNVCEAPAAMSTAGGALVVLIVTPPTATTEGGAG